MSGHIGTSSNLDWNTPAWIRNMVVLALGSIDLDPAGNDSSIIGASTEFKLPTNDGLQDPWNITPSTKVWVNPPWGRAYMKPDRSDIIGAKAFQALPQRDQQAYSVHTSIANWVTKAIHEWRSNRVETIMILPAATDTGHWQSGIWLYATSVCFIRGRVRFLMANGKESGPAPIATALVYWGTEAGRFKEVFQDVGVVLQVNSWQHQTTDTAANTTSFL